MWALFPYSTPNWMALPEKLRQKIHNRKTNTGRQRALLACSLAYFTEKNTKESEQRSKSKHQNPINTISSAYHQKKEKKMKVKSKKKKRLFLKIRELCVGLVSLIAHIEKACTRTSKTRTNVTLVKLSTKTCCFLVLSDKKWRCSWERKVSSLVILSPWLR